jgi:large subunit ribosomal protein L4
MARGDVYNLTKEKVDEITLSDDVFNAAIKPHLFHEVVRWQLAKKRSGTAAVKNRTAARGGGRKPWRQKGTGRARAGTIRSPLWRGGGTIFGPQPRSYRYALPKRLRRAALRAALSMRFQEGNILFLDDFTLPEIKTKYFVETLEALGADNALIVIDGENPNLEKSARNVPHVTVVRCEGLNVYDILRHNQLVILTSAKEKIEARLKS